MKLCACVMVYDMKITIQRGIHNYNMVCWLGGVSVFDEYYPGSGNFRQFRQLSGISDRLQELSNFNTPGIFGMIVAGMAGNAGTRYFR